MLQFPEDTLGINGDTIDRFGTYEVTINLRQSPLRKGYEKALTCFRCSIRVWLHYENVMLRLPPPGITSLFKKHTSAEEMPTVTVEFAPQPIAMVCCYSYRIFRFLRGIVLT